MLIILGSVGQGTKCTMAGRVDKVTTFKLFVKNLGYGTTQEELKTVFETCGRVVECQIFKNTLAFVVS